MCIFILWGEIWSFYALYDSRARACFLEMFYCILAFRCFVVPVSWQFLRGFLCAHSVTIGLVYFPGVFVRDFFVYGAL